MEGNHINTVNENCTHSKICNKSRKQISTAKENIFSEVIS
ncbi:hypothetical protein ALT785_150066 [Alteromonas infernus]